jgi:hypothetical protein
MSAGNQLQLATHLLAFGADGPSAAADRFGRMAAALKSLGQGIGPGQYDEVALLVIGGGQVDEIAARVIDYRDRLRQVKPKPPKPLAFSIATGVVLAEQVESADGVGTAATLRSVQALVEAQQAAMIACIAATTATTGAATSG